MTEEPRLKDTQLWIPATIFGLLGVLLAASPVRVNQLQLKITMLCLGLLVVSLSSFYWYLYGQAKQ